MLCPYCLQDVSEFQKATVAGSGQTYRCGACKAFVPLAYVDDYTRRPPVLFSFAGPPGHGKTVFMASLFYQFELQGAVWPDFAFTPVDLTNVERIESVVEPLRRGSLPPTTQLLFPEAAIIRLDGVPSRRTSGCHLLLYDTSGEAFMTVDGWKNAGRYALRSQTLIMLLSLSDVTSTGDLYRFLVGYEQTMREEGRQPGEQALLVVLTKCDKLLGRSDPPVPLQRFLAGQDGQMDAGLWDRIEGLSQAIEDWMDLDQNLRNFTRRARNTFFGVRYCAVSALGSEPQKVEENGQVKQVMTVEVRPRAVMVPFYWAWRLAGPRVSVQERSGRRRLFFDLQQAVAHAAPYSAVTVSRARHTVTEPVTITVPLALQGDGFEGTSVVGGPAAPLLRICADGPVKIRGLAFQHTGSADHHVAAVEAGQVELEACAFLNRTPAGSANGAAALAAEPGVRLKATKCLFEHHGGSGVLCRGAVEATLSGNHAQSNGGDGLRFCGEATGVANGNICARNGGGGILVSGSSRLDLQDNVCAQNGLDGIRYQENAGGEARANRCEKNQRHGVVVAARATPTIEANGLRGNGGEGLRVERGASPKVGENELGDNGGDRKRGWFR